MAVYPPPLQYFQGIIYNPDFFTSISSYITLSYANQNYLTRVGTSLSASSLTQFAGNVTILGLLTISGGINLSGGLTVDNLTVTGTSLFQGQSTFSLIPILPAGFQFITTGSQTITGTKTFNSIPIIPAGFQFITTGSQTITGLKTFSNVLTTSGINDSLSITSPTITGSTIVNAGTFNATNIAGTSNFYGATISGTLSCNVINNTSSTLPLSILTGAIVLPTTTTGDPRSGFLIGWNGLSGSNGETDFTNLNQGGNQGGFLFGNIPIGGSYQKLASLLPLNSGGLRLWPYCGNLRVDDNTGGSFSANMRQDGGFTVISSAGINTSLFLQCGNASGIATNVVQASVGGGLRIFPQCGQLRLDDINSGAFNTIIIQANNQSFYNASGINGQIVLQCGNASGVTTNAMAMTSSTVQPFVNFSPQSTTTFNAFHPTTTLGNNLSTNTTQYATVGYVNANNGASILPLNNTWTGLNIYTQRIQMTINTSTSTTCIGTNAGASLGTLPSNTNSSYYGFNAGVFSVFPQSETIMGAASGPVVTGSFSNNTVIGANSVFNGSGNTILGATSGNTSTTTVYNNSTTVGIGVLITASNQITLGRNTETVLIPGSANINGTLTTIGTTNINNTTMSGTAIVNNDLQVNGNITQPTGGILTGAVQTTFTTIPPYIIFVPVTGMSFVLPAPSSANAGQMFVIRKFGTGVGNPTIIFTCVGNLAVWVPLNSNATNTSLAISTVWQFTIVSVNNVYMTIA